MATTSADGENTRRYSYGSRKLRVGKHDLQHARFLVQLDAGGNPLDHNRTLSMPPAFALATKSGSQFSPSRRRAISTTM